MRPSAKANHDAARLHAESLRDVLEPMIRNKTTRKIAYELNWEGFRTVKGHRFTSMQVWRILKRLEQRRV
jgi:FixJ family two-component response regulator